MQKSSLRETVLLAIMAAIYVVLTVAVAPFAYGILQFRVSEVLNHLLTYKSKFIISLGVGVLLANLLSSAGLYDVVIGTGATLLCSAISIYAYRFIKSEAGRLAFNVFNFTFIGMIPIALMLFFLGAGESTIWMTYLLLLPGEFVILVIGAFLFYIINQRLDLKKLFK